jgi:phage gp36-like protein
VPYAEHSHIEMAVGGADRLVQLADWDGDGVADTRVLVAAQVAADSLIDSYARKRYATPFAQPSETVRRVAAEECVYWMRQARGMVGPTELEERKVRLAWLESLGKGEVRPEEPAPPKSSAVRTAWHPSTRNMSRRTLKGFW